MILKSKILLTAILAGSIIPVSSTFSGNLASADNEIHEEAIQTNTIDYESSTDDSTPSNLLPKSEINTEDSTKSKTQDLNHNKSGDILFCDGSKMHWELTNDGTLTISDYVPKYWILNSFRDGDFISNLDLVKHIVISSDKYYEIWENYSIFQNLESIVIPNSVKRIGLGAFSHCENLKNIVLSDSLERIDSGAFKDCISLTEIIIPNSVEYIGYEAFAGCKNLKSIVLPDSLERIDSGAFKDCISLTGVVIPNSVKYIGLGAFSHCENLKNIILSNTLEWIGAGAFADCISLTEVVIPNSVKYIDSESFAGCKNLKSIVLPDSLERIDSGAFKDCISLTGVVIPNSVKYIYSESFAGCKNLKSIVLSDSLEMIDSGTFKDCVSLTEVVIPNSVKSIGSETFARCENLKSIVLSDSLEWIDSGAFKDCISLKNLNLPNKTIKMVYYGDPYGHSLPSEEIISDSTFKDALEIYIDAFEGCSSLENGNPFREITENITDLSDAVEIFRRITEKRQKLLILNLSKANFPAEDIFYEIFEKTKDPKCGDYLLYNYYWGAPLKYDKPYSYYEQPSGSLIVIKIHYRSVLYQENEFDEKLKKLATDLNLYSSDLSRLQKLEAIYNWATSNIKYAYEGLRNKDGSIYTANAALVNKEAVCHAISLLLYRLCREAGFDSNEVIFTSGFGIGALHSWLIVKIGYYYYNIDATFDLGRSKNEWKYFLVSDQNHFEREKIFDRYKSYEFCKKHPMSPFDYYFIGPWPKVENFESGEIFKLEDLFEILDIEQYLKLSEE